MGAGISTAAILSTGTELVQGLYADTNARWLAEQLCAEGVEVKLLAASPDDGGELESLLSYVGSRVDLVVCSGGLGPTADDVNRQVFSKVFHAPLKLDEKAAAMIRERFARRGRSMPESNLVQAMVPRGAFVLYNEWGTAPGFFLPPAEERMGESARGVVPAALLALPGPPRELYPMFRQLAMPLLRERLSARRYVRVRTLHTFGAPESELGEYVKDLFASTPDYAYTMLAKPHGVDIRIVVRGQTCEDVETRLREWEEKTRARLPAPLVYGVDDETMASVVARLLIERHLRFACAESCTGGLLAKLLTDVAGSSAFFLGGWVTYSNEAKTRELGVAPQTLQRWGAVSEATAREMAQGALHRSGADLAVAITGIAGPSGGSPQKPVGTTYIALATPHTTQVRHDCFAGDREFNRVRAALTALNWVRLAVTSGDHSS